MLGKKSLQGRDSRPITALFTGHTHYGQMANDGHPVYVVTRSIGDPEGGPAGYSIVHLDENDLAVTSHVRSARVPVAMITHPRRLILATKPEHIVTGPAEARARGWSAVPLTLAQARMVRYARDDEMTWSFPIPGDELEKGEHTLEVRLIDQNKDEGRDRLTFACDVKKRYPLRRLTLERRVKQLIELLPSFRFHSWSTELRIRTTSLSRWPRATASFLPSGDQA